MLDHLPNELLIEIVTRLSIITLVRCACTCKSLQSLIGSPIFVTSHLQKTNTTHLFLHYFSKRSRKEYFSLEPDNESFVGNHQPLELPFQHYGGCFSIIGSCNGVICLSNDLHGYTNVIVLWNPSIRKILTLPKPPITFSSHGVHSIALGFGFDSITNDYKVVRLVYLNHGGQYRLPPKVEVYTLSFGFWRSISASGPTSYVHRCHIGIKTYAQCFLNGFLHWPGYKDFDCLYSTSVNVITTFDMRDEVFGEMRMPDSCTSCNRFRLDLSVGVCRDMLAIMRYHACNSEDKCCIWVMTEYGGVDSWTRLFSFKFPIARPKAFGFRRNEEILVVADHGPEDNDDRHFMVSVDPTTNYVKRLANFQGSPFSVYLDSYVESLALFSEGTGI